MRVRWVQQDWLRAEGHEPSIYVFDNKTVAGYSQKRIGFLYECLLELPVEITKGSYEMQIARFCVRHAATELVTTATPDPRAQSALERIRNWMPVDVEEPEPFVEWKGRLDLRRFSRYWSRVESQVLPGRRMGR
jgi:hypothetical protein